MPELPEVERAARILRKAAVGKTITEVRLIHPSHARRVTAEALESVRGRRILSIERRGKHQLLRLDDGATIHVHFRMNGDWAIRRAGDELPRSTRASIHLDDSTRVDLDDSRALSTVTVHAAGDDSLPDLGPEATSKDLTAAYLKKALSRRKSAIKPALLDQSVIAGLGNIYAAEALWGARINPAAPASSLSLARLTRLVDVVKEVLSSRNRPPGRYTEMKGRSRFAVYDREGQPCKACKAKIRRIVQAGRSTYYCARCQKS